MKTRITKHMRSFQLFSAFFVGMYIGSQRQQSGGFLFLLFTQFSLKEPSQYAKEGGPRKRKNAIIVPYRNRSYHLKVFQQYMGRYLKWNFPNESFSLWIIEQANSELFNRGWLANVGINSIAKLDPSTECVVFHDVDLIPSNNSVVPYNDCKLPIQLGSELQHFGWGVPYHSYAGGVVSLHLNHWFQINGFSNDFEGWGGEDDDLFHRLRQSHLLDNKTKTITRPGKGKGVFHTISQEQHYHPPKVRGKSEYQHSLKILREMGRGSDRWKTDGLSDLTYHVLDFKNSSSEGFLSTHTLRVVP